MKHKTKQVALRVGYVAVTVLLVLTVLSLVYRVETNYALRWNPIATVVLAGFLAVLLFCEKRFGYFAWLKRAVKGRIDLFKELLAQGKKGKFYLHLFTVLVTAATVLLLGGLMMLGYYSNASLILAFFATVLAVLLQLTDRIVLGKGLAPASLFLMVALLVGTMMCYVMPPAIFVTWDDETHFRRAYDLVFILNDERSEAVADFFTYKGFPKDSFINDPASFVEDTLQGSETAVRVQPQMSNPYSAFGYTPLMATLALLTLLGADLVKIAVLCRLANLFAFAFIVYAGIRKLKRGATIFSAVCLLPCVLFLASTHNYDFWLTAWFAYAFATLFAALQRTDRKLTPSDLWRVLLAFFLGCGPKAIYCAMLLPLLFIGKDRFENPAHAKKFRIWTVALIGFITATLVVPGLVAPDLYTDTRGGEDVSVGGQISFILSNPLRYADILFKFLSEYCSFYQMNTYTAWYGYLGNAHVAFGSFSAFMLLFCAFTDRKPDDGYEKMQTIRWITIFAFFAQLILIATSLYTGFTPVGLGTVNGCQYRYIFPLLIPFCFFLSPKKLSCEIQPRFVAAFVYGGLALNLFASFYNVYLTRFIG